MLLLHKRTKASSPGSCHRPTHVYPDAFAGVSTISCAGLLSCSTWVSPCQDAPPSCRRQLGCKLTLLTHVNNVSCSLAGRWPHNQGGPTPMADGFAAPPHEADGFICAMGTGATGESIKTSSGHLTSDRCPTALLHRRTTGSGWQSHGMSAPRGSAVRIPSAASHPVQGTVLPGARHLCGIAGTL